MTSEAASEVAQKVLSGEVSNRAQLEAAKRNASRSFSLDRFVTSSEILAALPPDKRGQFRDILRTHPRRSGSGIVVVTAFSAPFGCPHGICVFCPGGPRSGTPQSYLPASPGMRAAIESEFDPYLQVRKCLAKYASNGHETEKVETIIEGGTFIALDPAYRESFVRGVFDGLNGAASTTLEGAQTLNEGSASRCVGLTLESKPDWCRPADIDEMLRYGITRLEVGVQSLRDEALSRSNRGHSVADSVDALRTARDAGLKVTVHMMPGLPGSDPEADLQDLRRLFEDEAFRPDMMKLYPTLVVEGTALERQFKAGLYEPYSLQTVVEVLAEMKGFVPRWHRIMRIQREIPAYEITGGVRAGNLRELVLARAREKGHPCGCIRCREVALREPGSVQEDELSFMVERYAASGGKELFLSFEYPRVGLIAGFLRLRLPSGSAHRREMLGAAVVRELRVYGRQVGLGERDAGAWQHRGLGGRLMAEAERLAAEELGASKLLVTSAVGTRGYYRRLRYEREGPYMAKRLA